LGWELYYQLRTLLTPWVYSYLAPTVVIWVSVAYAAWGQFNGHGSQEPVAHRLVNITAPLYMALVPLSLCLITALWLDA